MNNIEELQKAIRQLSSVDREIIADWLRDFMFAAFHAHLRGGPCSSFMNNFKLQLDVNESKFFYYPDVMVACGPQADDRQRCKSSD